MEKEMVFDKCELDLNEEFPEKNRTRAVRRKKSWAKALRKNAIARHQHHPENRVSVTHDDVHRLMDNKVHCSCALCAGKTNGKHIARRISGTFHKHGKNWSASDVRKLERDRTKLAEYIFA